MLRRSELGQLQAEAPRSASGLIDPKPPVAVLQVGPRSNSVTFAGSVAPAGCASTTKD